VAIKCFCKITLKQKKEYIRRKDGKGMEVKTQLDKVMQHEVCAISKASGHPNVVNLIEIIDDDEAGKLLLVMEFVERGKLIEWQPELGRFCTATWALDRAENGFLNEEVIRCCVKDVVSGLNHLHTLGVMHRDIKP
jgi:serine/threonine protein kinase